MGVLEEPTACAARRAVNASYTSIGRRCAVGCLLIIVSCSTHAAQQAPSPDHAADEHAQEPSPDGPVGNLSKPLNPRLEDRRRTIAMNAWNACAIRDGQLYCWGATTGVPSAQSLLPLPPARLPPVPMHVRGRVRAIAMSDSTSPSPRACMVLDEGDVLCWGETAGCVGESGWTRRIPLPLPALEVAHLGGATCARLMGGSVYCWGIANDGESVGEETCQPRPVRTPDGRPLTGLVRAEVHAGVDEHGTVHWWGPHACDHADWSPRGGQHSRGLIAQPVAGMPAAVDVGTFANGLCVLDEEGRAYCISTPSCRVTQVEAPPARLLACGSGGCAVLPYEGGGLVWVGWADGSPPKPELGALHDVESVSFSASASGGCVAGDEIRCWGAVTAALWDGEPADAFIARRIALPPPEHPCD